MRRLDLWTRLRRRPRWAALLVLACGGVLAAGGLALGSDATVRSASSLRYSPSNPTPSIPGGGTLDFQNASAASHNVTANRSGPDGKSLFTSGTFTGRGSGVTRAVKGVQYLPAGTYKFHCTVHPFTMTGTLSVIGGNPVARPDIDVSILSTKLHKVLRSKRLRVRVEATTKSNNVALVAKKGSKKLAHKSNVDLGAGDSKPISMRLTKKGKQALKGHNRAKVKLRGTVPFGGAGDAKRTLR